jgi:uncharacterized membrane protein YebE (DUF533 family)
MVAGIVTIGAVFMLPVILAILHVILMILITSAGIAAGGAIGYLTYRVTHRHQVPAPPWQRRTELPRTAQKALPADTTHVTLTVQQYENLVRRLDNGS